MNQLVTDTNCLSAVCWLCVRVYVGPGHRVCSNNQRQCGCVDGRSSHGPQLPHRTHPRLCVLRTVYELACKAPERRLISAWRNAFLALFHIVQGQNIANCSVLLKQKSRYTHSGLLCFCFASFSDRSPPDEHHLVILKSENENQCRLLLTTVRACKLYLRTYLPTVAFSACYGSSSGTYLPTYLYKISWLILIIAVCWRVVDSGTGTNCCYVEDLDKVELWTGDKDEPRQVSEAWWRHQRRHAMGCVSQLDKLKHFSACETLFLYLFAVKKLKSMLHILADFDVHTLSIL